MKTGPEVRRTTAPVTVRQLTALYARGRACGMTAAEIDLLIGERYQCAPSDLTRLDASRLLDELGQRVACGSGASR